MIRFRRIYILSLLGAMGGLVGAVLHQWLIVPRAVSSQGPARDPVLDAMAGLLIGASLLFFPRFSEALARSSPAQAAISGWVWLLLGGVGGLVALPLAERLHYVLGGGYTGRIVAFAVFGLAIGTAEALAGGARRWKGLAGGLSGGIVAGVLVEYLVVSSGGAPEGDTAILALMLLGLFIALGVALFVHIGSEAWLEGLAGNPKVVDQVFQLGRFHEPLQAVIGSRGKPFLWIPEAEDQHAALTLSDRGTLLMHLAKQKETYVNDASIKERILRDGDVIKIANARLRYHESAPPAEAPKRVRFHKTSK